MSKPASMSDSFARCIILAKQGAAGDTQGDQEYDQAAIEYLERLHADVQLLKAQFKAQVRHIQRKHEHPGGPGLTADQLGEPQLGTLDIDIDDKGDVNKTIH